MDSCLIGYIGFRAACLVAPGRTTEVYVDDLAGINSTMLASISDDIEKLNFLQEYQAIERRAALRIERDVVANINPLSFSSEVLVVDPPVLNGASDNQIAPRGLYEGLRITSRYSNYAAMVLPEVQVYASTPYTGAWAAYDMYTGAVLASGSAVLVQGYNSVPVRLSVPYNGRKLDVLFLIEAAPANVAPAVLYGSDHGYCGDCNDREFSSLYIRPVYTDTMGTVPVPDNTGNAWGIVAQPQLVCSAQRLVCQLLPRLTSIWLDLLASEIFIQVQISTRMNRYTLNNPEAIEALRARHESQYATALKQLMSNIQLPTDECLCMDTQVQFHSTW